MKFQIRGESFTDATGEKWSETDVLHYRFSSDGRCTRVIREDAIKELDSKAKTSRERAKGTRPPARREARIRGMIKKVTR